MKLGHLDLRSTSGHQAFGWLTEQLRIAGWPTLGGLLAATCGLAVLVAAWNFDQQARRLRSPEASSQLGTPGSSNAPRQFARATEAIFTVPEDRTHLDDLNRLFKLAKAKGIQIGTVEYRQEQKPSLQVLVRTLDIRIHEDYPKLKGFVAELLGTLPHASLQEIRVERKDASAPQGQMLLKLAFVYRAPATSSVQSRSTP